MHNENLYNERFYICFIYIYMGRGAPNEFLGCPPELVFQPLFLRIVVDVKALGSPHVLRLCLGK